MRQLGLSEAEGLPESQLGGGGSDVTFPRRLPIGKACTKGWDPFGVGKLAVCLGAPGL